MSESREQGKMVWNGATGNEWGSSFFYLFIELILCQDGKLYQAHHGMSKFGNGRMKWGLFTSSNACYLPILPGGRAGCSRHVSSVSSMHFVVS